MDPKLKNALGYVGAAVAIVIAVYYGVLTKQTLRAPVGSQIMMSAVGRATAAPDIAQIGFSIVTTGKEAAKVQEDNDKKMAKVIDFLKSKGVTEADIKTANYNLYPQYNYNTGEQPPPITGYTLNQSVTAKIRNLESVSGIIGSLTSQGVNQIDNVSYSIDDPDSVKAEARQEAVAKARAKAEELAQRLGVRLGRVVGFSENDYSDPGVYPRYDAGFGGGGASPVQPGTQDVEVQVTLTFELK